MHSVHATFREGRVELTEPVDWPDGTPVEVRPLPVGQQGATPKLTRWPDGFFEQLRQQWGSEPFERPEQGDFEERGDW